MSRELKWPFFLYFLFFFLLAASPMLTYTKKWAITIGVENWTEKLEGL